MARVRSRRSEGLLPHDNQPRLSKRPPDRRPLKVSLSESVEDTLGISLSHKNFAPPEFRRRTGSFAGGVAANGVSLYYRIREGRLLTIRARCGSQRVLRSSIEALMGGRQEAGTATEREAADVLRCARADGARAS